MVAEIDTLIFSSHEIIQITPTDFNRNAFCLIIVIFYFQFFLVYIL